MAAPAAGLHFTDTVFSNLQEKQIDCDEVTLHVGAGTFRPVKADTIAGHEMHAEQIIVRRSLIEKILSHSGKLIAVGTTSIRTLESLYWLGASLAEQPEQHPEKLEVAQWQPYQNNNTPTKTEALEAILNYSYNFV